jgi:RNA polymerase primary sigma factor
VGVGAARERALLAAARDPSTRAQALAALLRAHRPMVVRLARHRERFLHHMQLRDLVQEGFIALLLAIEVFVPVGGARLGPFAAVRVRTAIDRAIADQDRTVRVGPNAFARLREAERRHPEPWHREGMQWSLGLLIRGAERVDPYGGPVVDVPLSESLESLEPSADEHVVAAELRVRVAEALAEIEPAEREALCPWFGADGAPERALDEIAADMGVTANAVRRLQSRGLNKLRKGGLRDRLRPFWIAAERE